MDDQPKKTTFSTREKILLAILFALFISGAAFMMAFYWDDTVTSLKTTPILTIGAILIVILCKYIWSRVMKM